MAKYELNGIDSINEFVKNLDKVFLKIEDKENLFAPKFINFENISIKVWKKRYGINADFSQIKHEVVEVVKYNKTMYNLKIIRCYETEKILTPKE
ncbi:MAG: hypothetical protein L3J10_04280 [Sulfurimonas sp.]|nr:hypothetical protein [Sulfurimonas sp.]